MYLYNTQLIYAVINDEAVSTQAVPHFHTSYTHEHTWIYALGVKQYGLMSYCLLCLSVLQYIAILQSLIGFL